MKHKIERRTIDNPQLEVRTEGEEIGIITGYAALFNSETDIGEYREMISPSAFAKTIQESDVKLLVNHNEDLLLGRNKSGTLRLEEDEIGLRIINNPPNTTLGNDIKELLRRKDIDQMSFGFRVIKDEWTEQDTQKPLRTIREASLFDVSIVVYPAYEQTSVQLRKDIAATDLKAVITNLIKPSKEASEGMKAFGITLGPEFVKENGNENKIEEKEVLETLIENTELDIKLEATPEDNNEPDQGSTPDCFNVANARLKIRLMEV